MSTGRRKNETKMSHMVRLFCVILIFVFLAVVVYLNMYSLRKIREQELQKEQDVLETWVQMWDKLLENNTIFIENLLANNEDVVRLGSARTRENRIYALQDIKATLNEYAALNYGMSELFFYSDRLEDEGYLASYRYSTSTSSWTLKQRIDTFIQLFEEKGIIRKWLVENINGENYLIYISENNGNYAGCWCSIDYLLSTVTKEHMDSRNFFVTDGDGVSRTNSYKAGAVFDLSASLWIDEENHVEYRQIQKKSTLLDIYFVEHIEKSVQEQSIIQVRNVMIMMCGLLALVLVIFTLSLEYALYRPIRRLVLKMQMISEGKFDSKITGRTYLKEIRILNSTFNTMVDEIRNLKIAIYEDEIREQKVRLQYLQMQIRPHFLVNALNSVYSMVEMKNEEGAKDMCRHLMQYFRFLYNKKSELVLITDELEHVKNYMKIQEMRRPNRITFDYHVDEDCQVCLVPPLLLQTFVENSIKYGFNMEEQHNHVFIDVTGNIRKTQIIIRDNGPGFPERVLDMVRHQERIERDGRECVGIQNVMARLKLFYGKNAALMLYNDGGAVVKIEILN